MEKIHSIGHVYPELWAAKVVIYTTLNWGRCLFDDMDSGELPLHVAYTGWIEQPATDLSLHSFPYYRGGGSATATTAMAVPIVKQNMGVVNVEALKRAWHSII